MSKITRISFIGVWTIEIIFLPLGLMLWLFGISQQGWPEVKVMTIAHHNEGYLMKIVFMNMLVSNIPDYLSILLYVKMYIIAKTTIEPEIEMQNQEAYGGIWVGENVLPVNQQPPNDLDAQVQAIGQQQQDKMKSILNFLKWNSLFCLVDFLTALLWELMICQGIFAIILCYSFTNFVCYSVPMLLLAINFKKFRSFWICNNNA